MGKQLFFLCFTLTLFQDISSLIERVPKKLRIASIPITSALKLGRKIRSKNFEIVIGKLLIYRMTLEKSSRRQKVSLSIPSTLTVRRRRMRDCTSPMCVPARDIRAPTSRNAGSLEERGWVGREVLHGDERGGNGDGGGPAGDTNYERPKVSEFVWPLRATLWVG